MATATSTIMSSVRAFRAHPGAAEEDGGRVEDRRQAEQELPDVDVEAERRGQIEPEERPAERRPERDGHGEHDRHEEAVAHVARHRRHRHAGMARVARRAPALRAVDRAVPVRRLAASVAARDADVVRHATRRRSGSHTPRPSRAAARSTSRPGRTARWRSATRRWPRRRRRRAAGGARAPRPVSPSPKRDHGATALPAGHPRRSCLPAGLQLRERADPRDLLRLMPMLSGLPLPQESETEAEDRVVRLIAPPSGAQVSKLLLVLLAVDLAGGVAPPHELLRGLASRLGTGAPWDRRPSRLRTAPRTRNTMPTITATMKTIENRNMIQYPPPHCRRPSPSSCVSFSVDAIRERRTSALQ